jgi:protein tyrosine/serine phosphatase
VCALALAAVGVPREAIVADYLATGDRLGPLLARLRASSTYAADLEGRPDASHRPRPETMARVLDVLDERHGGAPGWLAEHGFGDREQAALRRRLVA